jgi:serpin B
MTYNGANGTTKSAMAQALELDEMTLEEANQANLVLLSNLAYADETVRLAIANSLWARQGMNFDEDFLERNRHFYGARVSALDFNAPSSVDTINGWVSANTQGKIPTIIDEISGDAILFLINAIYFKGEWTDKFDAQATSPADFSLFSGARKSIPMMRRHGRFSHLENDRFEAVSLPYGNGRFSMFVFLPKANSSLSELNETLTATNWSNWVAQFDTMAGTVGLPRFETTYEELLNEALIQLGMGVAFDQARADFSGMLPVSPAANAFISKVKHKTFLRVDEEGSEAAAVTSVEIRLTSAPISFNMIVDRPFFFAICDNKSKSLLFLGSIIDPS